MCYSEFNDIIANCRHGRRRDHDRNLAFTDGTAGRVRSIQLSERNWPRRLRYSQPARATTDEIVALAQKGADVLPVRNLWVNPDCGLKTRHWPETEQALKNMVQAAQTARKLVVEKV
jgi:5-methyltetrahydropteroyltriglutamate--homocysteine methyltransferase